MRAVLNPSENLKGMDSGRVNGTAAKTEETKKSRSRKTRTKRRRRSMKTERREQTRTKRRRQIRKAVTKMNGQRRGRGRTNMKEKKTKKKIKKRQWTGSIVTVQRRMVWRPTSSSCIWSTSWPNLSRCWRDKRRAASFALLVGPIGTASRLWARTSSAAGPHKPCRCRRLRGLCQTATSRSGSWSSGRRALPSRQSRDAAPPPPHYSVASFRPYRTNRSVA
mmetsp:Transcript_13708/g.23525  ORF Transcript_13708/g.23525 Transcript_13708/m.23525 type:complete len:221 (+) Transcript_13708:381-1043(+)